MSTQDPPDTAGTPYVWTEREQIDHDLICGSCQHINEPDTIHCEECDTFLLEDEDAVDPDDGLDDHVGKGQATSEEEVYEAWEAILDNIVIGTYEHIKGGFKLYVRMNKRLAIFFGLIYVGMWLAMQMGFDGLLGVIGGGIAGIVYFGYLFRNPNTPMSQMA